MTTEKSEGREFDPHPGQCLFVRSIGLSVLDDSCSLFMHFVNHEVGAGAFTYVYGHITLKTPVLVRSLKLSNVELR